MGPVSVTKYQPRWDSDWLIQLRWDSENGGVDDTFLKIEHQPIKLLAKIFVRQNPKQCTKLTQTPQP